MCMLFLKSFKFSVCYILYILGFILKLNDIVFDRDYYIEIIVMCLYVFKYYGNKYELFYFLN